MADRTMRALTLHLLAQKWMLAGFVQLNEPQDGRSRCSMALEELSSGARISISEDRGPAARGCMLDLAELTRASAIASVALERRPDLLVINKFGKTEAAGRGFRHLIAEAFVMQVPLLIAVPCVNVTEWRDFAADVSTEFAIEALSHDVAEALQQLGFCVASTSRHC
jgi:nucleoside-triphosphatase THEP1